jgi:hypothetical protein
MSLSNSSIPDKTMVYVLDGHLPVHHLNVHDEKILVLTSEFDMNEVPLRGDEEIWEAHREEDLVEDEDEDEGEEQANTGEIVADGNGEDEDEESGETATRASDEENANKVVKVETKDTMEEGDGNENVRVTSPVDAVRPRKRLRNIAQAEKSNTSDDEIEKDEEDSMSKLDTDTDSRLLFSSDSSHDSESEEALKRRERRKERRLKEEKRLEQEERNTKKQIKRIVQRYNQYYFDSNHYGFPVSYFVYELALQLNRCRADCEWLACVGVTSHFINGNISRSNYDELADRLRLSVLKRSGAASVANAGAERGNIDEATGEVLHAGRDGFVLVHDQEPRFVLYRYWSLYNAMQASDYVASRLNLLNPSGDDASGVANLDRLIVKTGVKRDLVRQAYMHMRRDDRVYFFKRLYKELDDDTHKDRECNWKMPPNEVFFRSFVRYTEKESPRSAADVVHSLNGLLSSSDAAPGVFETLKRAITGLVNGDNDEDENGDGGSGVGVYSAHEVTSDWRKSFFMAYKSLSSGEADLFDVGVESAKQLRLAVMRVVPVLVRSGRVRNGDNLRWCEIGEDLSEAEARVFAHPYALAELGRALIRVHRDSMMKWRTKKSRKVLNLPLILTLKHSRGAEADADGADGSLVAGADAETWQQRRGMKDWVTVLGLPVSTDTETGELPSHDFLNIFRGAARISDVRHHLDSFDSSTLVIYSTNFPAFLEALDDKLGNQ